MTWSTGPLIEVQSPSEGIMQTEANEISRLDSPLNLGVRFLAQRKYLLIWSEMHHHNIYVRASNKQIFMGHAANRIVAIVLFRFFLIQTHRSHVDTIYTAVIPH